MNSLQTNGTFFLRDNKLEKTIKLCFSFNKKKYDVMIDEDVYQKIINATQVLTIVSTPFDFDASKKIHSLEFIINKETYPRRVSESFLKVIKSDASKISSGYETDNVILGFSICDIINQLDNINGLGSSDTTVEFYENVGNYQKENVDSTEVEVSSLLTSDTLLTSSDTFNYDSGYSEYNMFDMTQDDSMFQMNNFSKYVETPDPYFDKNDKLKEFQPNENGSPLLDESITMSPIKDTLIEPDPEHTNFVKREEIPVKDNIVETPKKVFVEKTPKKTCKNNRKTEGRKRENVKRREPIEVVSDLTLFGSHTRKKRKVVKKVPTKRRESKTVPVEYRKKEKPMDYLSRALRYNKV